MRIWQRIEGGHQCVALAFACSSPLDMAACIFNPWVGVPSKGPLASKNRILSSYFRCLPSRPYTFKKARKLGLQVQCKQATGDALLVKECIQKLSYATGLHHSNIDQHFTVSGLQCLFGMEGKWTLAWCMDGRYYEKYDGQEVTYEWGFDGKHNPWYADYAGRVIKLELDDLEIGQLSALVRTGFWLTDMGQDQLDIQIEGETSLDALKQQIGELILAIRLKEKKVVANVTIDACQWLPHSMEIKVLGQIHRWEYKDWRPIGCGINQKFPHSCVYHPAGGGRHSYTVSYSTLNSRGKDGEDKVDIDNLYSFPKTSLIPRYNKYYPQTSIDIGCPPAVKMIRANSGQLLVRPLVDNQDIGYFVLDTGASGLSICPKQVELLRMEAFGEVFITGFDGQVKSRFCRGKTFQLGPLIIKSPLFMEVSLDNLVTGVEEVVGVCGFDVFYHSIVEISCKEGQVSLFDYSHYENTLMEAPKWERICFLQNVPNVPVKINGQDSILLIDTGAGGVDVIFHSKAKRYSNLQFEGLASVKGINSTNGGLQVHAVIIDTLEIASHSFKEVQAVYLSGSGNQLHLSEYTSGVLCAELLAKCTVIFDYSRCRMALVGMKSNHA